MAKAERAEGKKKKSGKGGLLVVATLAGITGVGIANSPEDSPGEQPIPSTVEAEIDQEAAKLAAFYNSCSVDRYGTGAFVAMKLYVKQRLNDPGSAKFSYRRDLIRVDRSSCTFFLSGAFSAKNGFGGRVRGAYEVELRRTQKGGWVPVKVTVK